MLVIVFTFRLEFLLVLLPEGFVILDYCACFGGCLNGWILQSWHSDSCHGNVLLSYLTNQTAEMQNCHGKGRERERERERDIYIYMYIHTYIHTYMPTVHTCMHTYLPTYTHTDIHILSLHIPGKEVPFCAK